MVFASFNYTGPDWLAIGIAWGIAVVLAIIAFYARSIWCGVITGVLYGGAAGWIVIGMGKGDMTGLMQMLGSPMLAAVGGVIGGIAAGFGKWIAQSMQSKGDQE